MKTKTYLRTTLIILAALALGGCNLPFGGEPVEPTFPPTQDLNLLATLTQQALEHSVQETASAPTITSSPTITPTEIPEVTPGPSQTPIPNFQLPIKFLPGGTISFSRARIQAGAEIPFTLEAGEGQTLIASVSSEGNQVTLEIKNIEQDEVLVPFSDEATSVQVKLPWSGEYQVTLASPADLDYLLTVEVPANVVVSPGLGPSVVNGTINVQQAFHPDVFTRVRYLMQLPEGSGLDVQLTTNVTGLALALIGAEDGQPYLRHEVKNSSIEGFVVPETQAYYLDVYSVEGESGAFSLSIAVQ